MVLFFFLFTVLPCLWFHVTESFTPLKNHKLGITTKLQTKQIKVYALTSDLKQLEHDETVDQDNKSKTIPDFNWYKQWYPLAVEECTDKGKIHNLQLLGNDVALWFDGLSWRAFEDFCPHRGVPLSEGRVEKTGELLCAYHAWTFNGNGECTKIPQSKTPDQSGLSSLNSKTCVQSFPVQVQQGLIWVWGEKGRPGSDVFIEALLKQPHLIEELSDPSLKDRILLLPYNFRDLPYGWDYFMENVLDPAHVPVSHHGITGNRYAAKHFEMKRATSFTERTAQAGGELNPKYSEDSGFCYINNVGDSHTAAAPASNDFRPPCLNKIKTENEDGSALILALYCAPTIPGYSRHIGAQIMIKNSKGKLPKGLGFFALPMPLWLLHALSSVFLHQDQVFLHHQERTMNSRSHYAFGRFSPSLNLTSDPKAYYADLNLKGVDKAICHLRNWIHTKAGGGPIWGTSPLVQPRPLRLAPAQLFDVYDSHTRKCKICQAGLKKLVMVRNTALVGAVGLFQAFMSFRRTYFLVAALVIGAASSILHKLLPLFYKYEYSHQNNN